MFIGESPSRRSGVGDHRAGDRSQHEPSPVVAVHGAVEQPADGDGERARGHQRDIRDDPAGALTIAAAFQIDPADFLYVGDTNTDMQTANAAGMFPKTPPATALIFLPFFPDP